MNGLFELSYSTVQITTFGVPTLAHSGPYNVALPSSLFCILTTIKRVLIREPLAKNFQLQSTYCALFTRSVNTLYAIDAGFEPANVTAIDVVAPTRAMSEPARAAFFEQVTARVAALPGVDAVGLVTRLPLRDGGWQGTVTIEDRPDLRDGREPNTLFRIISPAYLGTMGIALVQGRGFAATDGAGTSRVAIVSASFAERMWPGRDPLGQRVQHTFDDTPTWVTVVGVAEETRMLRMTGDNPFALYVPLAQAAAPEGPTLVVKGAGAAPSVAAIRAAVHELDSAVAVGRITTLDNVVAAAVAEPLRLRFFLTVLGALALVIGAVGDFVACDMPNADKLSVGIIALLAQRERQLISERTKAGLAVAKQRGVALGNPNPDASLRKAVKANIQRKREFAATAIKSIREIQSTGVETLARIADCMNKRGEKTPRGGKWTATAVKRVRECVAE